MSDRAQDAYEQYDADRVEARLLDAASVDHPASYGTGEAGEAGVVSLVLPLDGRGLRSPLSHHATARAGRRGAAQPQPSDDDAGVVWSSDMSAETYHRYFGIDAFVNAWMLDPAGGQAQ